MECAGRFKNILNERVTFVLKSLHLLQQRICFRLRLIVKKMIATVAVQILETG